jgi:alkyldihydroxyacetonephosphate synthase
MGSIQSISRRGSGDPMLKLYYEFNPNLDYSRENLRWNGWGAYQEDFYAKNLMVKILDFLRNEIGVSKDTLTTSITIDSVNLPSSKFSPRDITSFKQIVGKDCFNSSRNDRIFHSVGRSYYDIIRLNFNLVKDFVDGVVYPTTDKQIEKILDYCSKNSIAVIPFGGGSSVVGGIEATKSKGQTKILSLDLLKFNQLIAINNSNKTATFQSGIYGPKLEQILNKEGFTLGHFPQSFVYSTLGGWVAARSAGQQSNRYGKIEEMMVCCSMRTPEGIIKTGDYPASSTGPNWNHIIAGSEGLLGVITDVTVKIHELPEKRYYTGILFPSFHKGKECIREINQNGLSTAMLRLSDEEEARLFGTLGTLGSKGIFHAIKNWIQNIVLNLYGLKDKKAVLILGLEGCPDDIEMNLERILEIARKHNGFVAGEKIGLNWMKNRFNMPFLRNHLVEHGFGVDTMETSAPYDQLESIREDFHKRIKALFKNAKSLCHISHSYENGACLYFTVIFQMDSKKPVEQWIKLKKTASQVFFDHGASASHHHGIGMDHKEWYLKEFGKLATQSLTSLKATLDKKGIMNPKKVFHS